MKQGSASHIYIVTGRVQAGKTTFVGELVDALKNKRLSIAGFLCRGTFSDGKRDSFTLKALTGGVEIPFASSDFRQKWFRYRRFYFNPAAFEQGTEMVRASLSNPPDLIVIDEVGPMELREMGWNSLLRELAAVDTIPQIWIARDRVVDAVRERWAIPTNHLITIQSHMQSPVRERLFTHLSNIIVNFDPLQ